MNEDIKKEFEDFYSNSKSTGYEWIKETWNIIFWEYAHVNSALIDWFYINMDSARDIKTGWPMFVEMLGLRRAHIEHCELYPGSLGPTRKAFQYLKQMEEKNNMTLGLVLEILKDLNRHDLLNPSFIHWKDGIVKFQKWNRHSLSQFKKFDNKPIKNGNDLFETIPTKPIKHINSEFLSKERKHTRDCHYEFLSR
ncbi:unnamed protein product [Meganyctiphanes norvegica]|uniref:Death domain-containing protein n=1 Tax=Meganyctiphanes norvegica TaxID=48144 RepID=A0AAV2QBU6_MEGNR